MPFQQRNNFYCIHFKKEKRPPLACVIFFLMSTAASMQYLMIDTVLIFFLQIPLRVDLPDSGKCFLKNP